MKTKKNEVETQRSPLIRRTNMSITNLRELREERERIKKHYTANWKGKIEEKVIQCIMIDIKHADSELESHIKDKIKNIESGGCGCGVCVENINRIKNELKSILGTDEKDTIKKED